ncbi:MAG TPA: ABC transporter permease [Acidobacteriaceae bacterium]|nr:ABC transporter permease [Acidobacteriaceae bacterium]
MGFLEGIKIALQSLWANKLRSFLTLLGVMIGVAAVIMVITLVNGANKFVATKVYGYGADVFTASKQPAVVFSDAEYTKYQKRKDLKIDDYRDVAAKCLHCAATGAMANVTGKVVYENHSSTDTDIRGWTWSMPPIYNMNIERGRGFVPIDDERHSHVAIIGADIVDNQMGGEDPIGKEIRVDGEHYRVIGVGERKGKTLGQSQDNWVAVPLTTFLNEYGSNRSLTIYGKANGVGDPLELASGEMRTILRGRRHDAPGAEDSFSIDTNATFVGIWQSISSSFSAVFISLAAISLVIGGIVIMNIMLVSVTERTREIGVRKALGARRRDLMLQFLIESATMALIGGLIGVLGGVAFAKIITLVVGFPSDIQAWPVLLGLLMATAVGVFFGVYPARKAAMLDPIVALRSEI